MILKIPFMNIPSTSITIACSLLMIILPIVPSSCLLLLPVINLLLIAVCVLFVCLSFLLLPLLSLNHVLILEFTNLLQSHCWFICIFLPNFSDKLYPLLRRTHAVMDLLFSWYFSDSNLRNRLIHLFFVLNLRLRIFFNRFFVAENVNFFFNAS